MANFLVTDKRCDRNHQNLIALIWNMTFSFVKFIKWSFLHEPQVSLIARPFTHMINTLENTLLSKQTARLTNSWSVT